MLVNKLTGPTQSPLAFLLCEFSWCHGLLQLCEIPASRGIAFRKIKRDMNIEVDPFCFRVVSAAKLVHFGSYNPLSNSGETSYAVVTTLSGFRLVPGSVGNDRAGTRQAMSISPKLLTSASPEEEWLRTLCGESSHEADLSLPDATGNRRSSTSVARPVSCTKVRQHMAGERVRWTKRKRKDLSQRREVTYRLQSEKARI